MIFEVHITGTPEFVKGLAMAGFKTIVVDLLTPKNQLLRSEHMTSHIMKCDSFLECHDRVYEELARHDLRLMERVKIECPAYDDYLDSACYIETHFESSEFKLPTSKNQHKTTYLATDRAYDQFDLFRQQYAEKEFELCLLDTNVKQDEDWMLLYGQKRQ